MKYILPILLFTACDEPAQNRIVSEGKPLAEKHCTGCHQFPEPELVDKKTWVYHVLPKMGSLLGFRYFESTTYFENDYASRTLSLDEWNKIVRYYVHSAPDSALKRENDIEPPDTNLKQFIPDTATFSVKPPLTSFVGIFDTQIIFADGVTKYFYRLDNLAITDSGKLETGISQLSTVNGEMYGLSMGVMYPSDERSGRLVKFEGVNPVILIDSLQRPVHASFNDLTGDSLTDIVVCEFGNNTGQLSLFVRNSRSSFVKQILKPLPGAVRSEIRDFNKDGRPDIMAMMAQGDEGMFIFYNEGNHVFREERLLRFSPAHGSNYFELADINADGFEDIIATNGDNGDYPPVLKPYHGIRVYLNDQQNHFKEKLFLPVNGACKVVARDFDKDGDLDLASIAYFPDYDKRPFEAFIYWQNEGDLKFKPYSFGTSTSGRWLVMDANDVDRDGDDDIVLGSAKSGMGLIPGSLQHKWNEASPSVMVLINTNAN